MGATGAQSQAAQGIDAFMDRARRFVDARLDECVPPVSAPPARLHEAMRYSLLAGGKRLRPALVLASAEAVGGSFDDAASAACAVEMIHTYSLIHDDLPAMDNDDLRRGRPTCHKVFGDAMAILAGDALLTLAFAVLAQSPRREQVPAMVSALARGSGCQGMAGGQVLDLEAEGSRPTLQSVQAIHAWKTAALISASCEIGALAGGGSASSAGLLRDFGEKIGLAFQIVDDILDVTSSPEELGKTPGKDQKAMKATYPAVLGLEESRAHAARLASSAADALLPFGARAGVLRNLAQFAVERRS